MQAQPQPQPQVTAVPPPPTSYVPSSSEVRVRTAKPPTFGTAEKNILNLSDETWAAVTPGKRELLGIVAWLVARFGKNSQIVNDCYRILAYIREPPSYPPPPLGWEPAVDELGRRFYVNQATAESQWCRPQAAAPDYVAPDAAPATTSFLTGNPFSPKPFKGRFGSCETLAEAQAQPDTSRTKEADPEWQPRWPTAIPNTSQLRRSQRIRTMSERSTASTASAVATEMRPTRQWQPRATPVRRSTRLASRA
jgi:hypothetical protein